MADSEEFRLKRLKHEEQMSRMFDEVMGLGDFADSSRGSVASSKSGGQTEAKGPSETLGLKENQPRDEDSSCSRKEGKMDEGTGEMNFPRRTSNKPSLFNLGGGVGGSGEAAFDDALDGLPLYGQEEEDEDWHFALPLDSMEDGDARKTNSNISQFGPQSSSSRGGPFPRKPADEEEEQQEREGSGESANTSHSSQDNTPDNSRDVLNQTEETEDSQQAETAEARPAEDCNPPASPGVKIKDEPIDEGYNAALLPQSSIRQIKEELEQQEEELRISSVYSVGGANTFTSPAMPAAIPIPTPTPTAIFIPGRGAVLQAMAPLPIRPPAVIQPPVPSLTAIPPRPPQPPAPGSVRCSGCTKVLLKGQTAFQRKGSTQLFCSTSCLTGHLPPATKYRSCFQCNREIIQPRDMVTIPGEENTYLQFCGQFCLSVFRHKRVQGDKIIDKRTGKKPQKPPEKPVERLPEKPICSVCKSTNKQIEHEVNHQGRLHKLCSNACFLAWRRLRQLAMNCCEGCGLYCNSSSGSCQVLTIEKTQLNFCSPTCVGTYKLTCRKMTECSNCHKSVLVSCTIMERDHKGKVQLYCTPSCVEQSRPPQHALSGTPFPCCLCKVSAVPQYHLAMVDGTIRNFCSYNCVSMFRKLGHVPQPELTNGTSSLRDPPNKDAPRPAPSAGASSVPPVPQDYPSSVPSHHSTHTSVPSLVPPPSVTPSPTVPGQVQAQSPPDETQKPTAGRFSDTVRVTCHQCSKQFSTKPLLLSHQGRISVFCCKTCSDQYKTQKNIVAPCESCKQEKVIYENFNYNQQDLFFCSETTPREKEKDSVKMVMVPVPVPVPVFVPVPVNIYPQHTPVALVIPMPVPVPIVASPKDKDTKDAEVQFEMLPEEETKREIVDVSSSDQRCSSEVIQKDEEAPGAADPPQPEFSETLDLQPGISKTAEHPPACCTKDQPPSSPLMDLEADIPPESVNRKVPVQQRGVKRPRDCSYSRKRGRRRTGPAGRGALVAPATPKLNHLYGVKAWRSWVQQRNKDPQESGRVDVKDDILQCNSAELSFALSDFIREVRRPNGDAYSPDSIFYLCLGIQQYLFEQGRIENIFTDELYSPFTSEISGILRPWRPKLLPSGGVVPSRVVESYLWECKQLGAYSPIVLLNTLLFFFTKTFHLTTVTQHQRLSFSSLTLRSKPCSRAGKVTSLVYRGGTATSGSEPTERFRKRPAENVGELELLEKASNPLQCPVRLYEFYLSRCPEAVKKRADAFYLQPERRVQTESPHWYSRQPLDANTLQSMLTRILAVREVQQEAERCRRSAAADGE
uniref:TRASH domain-containing protein n=1 Tax=Nothobranchius furzeri TaxID=105023 RepID=A0A8C6M312_NOTFU